MNWERSVPNQYKEIWKAFFQLSHKEKCQRWVLGPDDADFPRDFHWIGDNINPTLEGNSVAPMSVTWKSRDFPRSSHHHDIISWMKSAFSTLWKRVLESLDDVHGTQRDPKVDERAWDTCAERFAWVLTAGGRLIQDLSKEQQRDLLQSPISIQKEDNYRSAVQHPNPRVSRRILETGKDGDIDNMFISATLFSGYVGKSWRHVKWWHINSMIRALLCSTEQEVDSKDLPSPVLPLVEMTMKDNCLFTCDVDWKPYDALVGDIMGIGAIMTKVGDMILSISPSKKEDMAETEMVQCWTHPILVREAYSHTTEHLHRAYQNLVREHDALEKYMTTPRQTEGMQRVRRVKRPAFPPVYELVGSCFTTAAHWQSPIRGLHLQRFWKLNMVGSEAKRKGPLNYHDYDDRNSDVGLLDIILL
ncbi:hypothetical protein P171DRAFT_33553 [Karstenula rhodostoma CBS 690.94]|uniref:Uncharacterized protein n=1 Tax=Karstenula rhodostoma CBS 690.94 TaxID=1392251 RepID=A0A9P4PG75_9PLEO|nr:hypothetical protein P171DRAFT_33553 [Karstenula rhodostoma CBS 690.94]